MKNFSLFLEQKARKNYRYSTVLFRLPKELSGDIIEWGKDNIPDKSPYYDSDEPNSFGREDEIHCTVLYGLHDAKSQGAKDVLKDSKPFKVTLGNITFFNNPKFDVMKIEVTSPHLHKLHNLLKKNMEVTLTYPDYKPHVTIAYLKKDGYKKEIDVEKFNGIEFVVNTLLFSSTLGTKTPIRLSF